MSGEMLNRQMRPSKGAAVGLTAAEATARLVRDGPNELPRRNQRAAWRIALQVVREPMLAMLLAAGGIYLLLGDRSEAIILIVFAGFSVAVAIVQEVRTEKALAALGELAAPRAVVIRDGQPIRIAGREVVRDDLLIIEQGDRVAADAVLIEAENVECDESLLTGESVPVHKYALDSDAGPTGAEADRELRGGSIVTAGRGLALVTATGSASQIGRIGQLLATVESQAPRLQLETARIVRLCAIGGLGTAVLVALLYGFLRGGWMNALLTGIATAMSLLPEEFPVVLTVFLAMGAWRIARVGVLTRRTAAIDTLGAATVLCTDKTGTLTQNRMAVAAFWMPAGDVTMAGDAPGDAHAALLNAAALASAPIPIDPMEVAFHQAAGKTGRAVSPEWNLVHSNGLRSDLLAMSNVWQPGNGEPLMAAAKGAPEAIARLCRLDPAARKELDAAAMAMASGGMRVLGVASAAVAPDRATSEHLEHGFTLSGLIGLSDPVRPGVVEAVAQCRAAGIRVVMITGDYASTAEAIAAEIGLGEGETMTGDLVAALSDAQLADRVRMVSIFARTLPEQKLRIVTALKAAGEVVAMTGDGVNDAPALKAADIGVAMGRRGTDVAREAASLVLVDDDFGAIVLAIRLGRRIYDNIRKAVGFIFAVHVPIAGLALLPPLSGLPILLGPIQIALLEMIIDPVCALVFEAERDERLIMDRPPRAPGERLFAAPVVVRAVIEGGLAFGLLAGVVVLGFALQMPEAKLRTLVFFSLVAAVLALVLAHRSYSMSLGHALFRHNITFRYVLAAIVAGSGLVLEVPSIAHALGFATLGWPDLAIIAAGGATLLLAFELVKRIGGSPANDSAVPSSGTRLPALPAGSDD